MNTRAHAVDKHNCERGRDQVLSGLQPLVQHVDVVAQFSLNIALSFDILSKFGVFAAVLPTAPKASWRQLSARNKKMFIFFLSLVVFP